MESGWLNRELNEVVQEVKTWPAWLREEAGLAQRPVVQPKVPVADTSSAVSDHVDEVSEDQD